MIRVLIIGSHSYIGIEFRKYISKMVEYNNMNFNESDVQYSTENHIKDNRGMKDNIDIKVTAVSASKGEWKIVDFKEYDVVLHLSGIVHKRENKTNHDLYDEINHILPVKVATKARQAGVKQFIFMSTAAVFGCKSIVVTKETVPVPDTNYGISKLKAERDLMELNDSNFKVCILRSPMVYGPGCPGNFKRLQMLAKRLPVFPKLDNQRSMIYIDNLCEFIRIIIIRGSDGIYHPQNEELVNTCELVGEIRKLNNKRTLYVRGFRGFIHLLGHHIGSIDKMFGNWIYKKELSQYEDINYIKVSFLDSLVRCNKKQ